MSKQTNNAVVVNPNQIKVDLREQGTGYEIANTLTFTTLPTWGELIEIPNPEGSGSRIYKVTAVTHALARAEDDWRMFEVKVVIHAIEYGERELTLKVCPAPKRKASR